MSTDKDRIKKARTALIKRVEAKAFNENENKGVHVLNPSLAPREISNLVTSLVKLNALLNAWVE